LIFIEAQSISPLGGADKPFVTFSFIAPILPGSGKVETVAEVYAV
jgi:hypothetical protein